LPLIAKSLSHTTGRACAALLSALLLAFVVNLHPLWPLAWIAPVPLLLIALSGRQVFRLSFGAACLALCTNFQYYSAVNGNHWLPAAIIIVLQGLVWGAVVWLTSRCIRSSNRWSTVFVYPVVWSAVDVLINQFSPHSSFGSLAYSQGDALPVLQVASLAGTPGVVFLIGLFASTVAIGLWHGMRADKPLFTYGLPLLILMASLNFGFVRVAAPPGANQWRIGLAALDDFIGGKVPAIEADRVWNLYDAQIHSLAAQGAELIVLPEKIEVLKANDVQARFQMLSTAAQREHVYVAAGVGVPEAGQLFNRAWLFDPAGKLIASYNKQHLVPGLEREFTPGRKLVLTQIHGLRFALAICKDLHFPSLGRLNGQQRAEVIIDPAWDFEADDWLTARLTAVRGIENGFAILRSSREGLLTMTDPFGRILAESHSAPAPGNSLMATVGLGGSPTPTFYARYGDLFGWLCVPLSVLWQVAPKRPATAGVR
jgi:apolipoprotein N-acyltransferase